MKNIFSFIILLIVTISISTAAPLRNIPQILVQPDGGVVKCFASGDEYYHWLHDKNGYTITYNPATKYWVYAERKGLELQPTNYIVGKNNPQSAGLQKWLMPDYSVLKKRYETKLTSMNKHRLFKTSEKILSKGTINNLVVFIRFADQDGFTNELQYYQNSFDGDADTSLSFKNYYWSVSYNQLTINSTFYPTQIGSTVVSYQDIHTRDYYRSNTVAPDSGYANTDEGYARLSQVGKRAIENIASQVPAGLNIDTNNDGNIDNVVFLVAGNVEGWDDVLWPIQSTADFEAYINGKKVSTFNLQFDMALSVSVLCHEMFHSLGAPDLYHYKPENKYLKPVGSWDLMENDGTQNMTGYMKYRYGKWFNKMPEVTTAGTYTLNTLGGKDTTNVCYAIKSPNSQKEFFMIEYRNKQLPFESSIPSTGIIIYRINTELDGKGNDDGPPDEVYIFRPNGTATENGDIDCAAFTPDSNRTTFNYNTNPSCVLTDGSSGGINISNVQINGATASFNISFDPTAVENENELPTQFKLEQNYPNPFNPSTSIKYSVLSTEKVTLEVYDILGRKVATLVNEVQQAGRYSVQLSAIGRQLTSGVYFYRLTAGNYSATRKMLLLR